MSRFDRLLDFARLTALLRLAPDGLAAKAIAPRIGSTLPRVRTLLKMLADTTYRSVVAAGERAGETVYVLQTAPGARLLLRPLRVAEHLALLDALALAGADPLMDVLRERLQAGLLPHPEGVGPRRLIKGPPPLHASARGMSLVLAWESAVREHRFCQLTSVSARARQRRQSVTPLGTVFLAGTGIWHLAFRGRRRGVQTLPLERVVSVAALDQRFTPPADFSLKEHLRHSWGVDQGPIREVVIRFSATPANVLAKVLRETAARRPEITPLPEGGFLYRDRISGIEEIGQWIRGYGLAAEVLAPPELRERMRAGLFRYLDRIARDEADAHRDKMLPGSPAILSP